MFMNTFARRTGAAVFKNKRMMSGHSQEEVQKEVATWFKMTVGMTGLCVALSMYNVAVHSHEHARHGLPYQKIRSKPYPWACNDCNLFDGECWKECRGN